MRIAILTSGVLPVPAVQGGAVENLIDFILEYNNKQRIHDIDIYSVTHREVFHHPALQSNANHYHYINTSSLCAKLFIRIRHLFKIQGYYDDTIEYYLSCAIRQITKKSYDIILIENRPGYVLKLRSSENCKLVIHQENDYLNSDIFRCQEIYQRTSFIINTSDYITKRVKTINKDDKKCITILNGIDIEHFFQAKPMDRQILGFKKEDFIIAFSGRLTPEKGILQLIQAIKQLGNEKNIKLLIIGASAYGKDKKPTDFILQLEQESLPIKSKIQFTGYVDYELIPSYIKIADIAVIPSMWEEPFGLTVVEAMASGLPLITTNSGGIPEICEDNAIIVERDNIVHNLANSILDLYHHPDKRECLSRAAIERSKYFNKERYAKDFFDALESIGI